MNPTSSTTPVTQPPGAAATATLGAYLTRSAAVRRTVQTAIDRAGNSPESPARGEAILPQAINTRQDILNGLPALAVSGLADGAQLVSTLTTAIQDLISADRDCQKWLADLTSSGNACAPDPSQDSDYVAGQDASMAAATAKDAFRAIWNPMAPRYGQTTYSSTDL